MLQKTPMLVLMKLSLNTLTAMLQYPMPEKRCENILTDMSMILNVQHATFQRIQGNNEPDLYESLENQQLRGLTLNIKYVLREVPIALCKYV